MISKETWKSWSICPKKKYKNRSIQWIRLSEASYFEKQKVVKIVKKLLFCCLFKNVLGTDNELSAFLTFLTNLGYYFSKYEVSITLYLVKLIARLNIFSYVYIFFKIKKKTIRRQYKSVSRIMMLEKILRNW